ncbi:hypothetical protein HanPI659440_Chr17g0664081 [Helianthus annuus]|nr:hypothetical protein HanPI659440_Chr17g0664081 [Helianthus annuus]
MAHNFKSTTDLAKIGKESFADIDEYFPRGCQYSKQQVSHYHQYQPQQASHYHQYQPQQAYVVQQQVYAAPVTKRVITCNDAAKMYGGTLFVEYPKRKPARKGKC